MSQKNVIATQADKPEKTVRQKALQKMRIQGLETAVDTLTSQRVKELVYELEVHQIELEMQNEELRQTQLELEASRTRYFDLYDLAPVGYLTLTRKGLIEEVNLTACTLLGQPRARMVRRPFTQFILPSDQDQHYIHIRDLFNSAAPQTYELRLKQPNDAFFWARINVVLADDDHGRLVITDITERKQMEKALRQSETRFRGLIENAPYAFSLLGADSRLTYASPSTFHILGYQPEELVGLDPKTQTHPDDLPQLLPLLAELMSQPGQVVTTQYRMRHKDGRWRWLESNISNMLTEPGIEALVFNFKDITVRREAEEALQTSEENFRTLVELASDGIFIANAEGRYIDVNSAGCNMLGYSRDEILNKTIDDLTQMPPDKPLRLPELQAGQALLTERALICKNGSVLPVEISSKQLPDGRFQGIVRDITERKQAERDLKQSYARLEETLNNLQETQEQLVKQERLAAVGELAAGVAHDFNNILTIIMLQAELGLKTDDWAKINQRLNVILKQSNHAAQLVQQLLDFGRRALIQKKWLDVAAFLPSQADLLRHALPENIEIVFHVRHDDCMIMADETRLRQLFVNLALNARDAMPTGGQLTIAAEQIPNTKSPLIPSLPVGNWVQLTVQDNGTGMQPEILGKIFEPFFTTKEPGRGTGLGLAQVYGIVKQHEGVIDVQSTIGEGTTFTIYLPTAVSPQNFPIAFPAVSEDQIPKGHGEVVLLVEDNAILREVLVSTVEEIGYQTRTAANGAEALGILQASPNSIAIVLSDLVMPDMGGEALFRALRQQQIMIPVVMLSGYPMEPEFVKDLVNEGLAGYLMKPPQLEALAQILAKALP